MTEFRTVAGASAGLAIKRIRPAYEQVAEQLRSLIVAGALVPGERLPVEADLVVNFGVSRSTVREALRVLGSEGLVRTTRGVNGGTFVAEADLEAINEYLETRLGLLSGHDAITARELVESRQLLGAPAARLAAERRTEEQLEQMAEAIEQERAEAEHGASFEHHQRFHVALLDAAQNCLLKMLTVPIIRVIRARFSDDIGSESRIWLGVDDDHETILVRVRDGDADGAERAMVKHLSRLSDAYRRTSV